MMTTMTMTNVVHRGVDVVVSAEGENGVADLAEQ
jgi:hypothetical protein